jgi:hypothetical protein
MGEIRNAYKILAGKPEGKRPLRRPGYRGVDNIKMHLRETGFGVVDWIYMALDSDQLWVLVNTVMDLCVPAEHTI